MEKGWLAVIRIWRIYANDLIFVVLYLSFNFEMSPCGPSNKNLASGENETCWGVSSSEVESYSRGARPSSEAEVRPRAVRPSSKVEVRSRVVGAVV
jgi:hypothetical protein